MPPGLLSHLDLSSIIPCLGFLLVPALKCRIAPKTERQEVSPSITCLNFMPYGPTCDKAGGLVVVAGGGGSWRSKELCLFRTNDLTLISSSGSRSVVPMKKLIEIKSLFQEGEHRWGGGSGYRDKSLSWFDSSFTVFMRNQTFCDVTAMIADFIPAQIQNKFRCSVVFFLLSFIRAC